MVRLVAALILAMIAARPALAGEQECLGDDALLRTEPAAVAAECLRLADSGDARAQNRLGVMYAEGWLVPKDSAAAVAWYRKAAAQGDGAARANLAFMLMWGIGVARDYREAYIWATLAEESGNRRAGDLLRSVLGHLSVAALAEAQMRFGELYATGKGLPADQAKAATWFRHAAQGGLAAAQSELARRYFLGLGIEQDARQAYYWASLAANAGRPEAAPLRQAAAGSLTADQVAAARNDLGLVYEEGRLEPLVPTDYARALALFHEAALAGNVRAQINLALMYLDGHGVPQDLVQAYLWFSVARRSAPQDDLPGLNCLAGVASQLSAEQIAAATVLAKTLVP
jgi:TPR repeat protein